MKVPSLTVLLMPVFCIPFFIFKKICLLVGAFNPFTFTVNIDMYHLITIFLIVLGLFFWVFFYFFFNIKFSIILLLVCNLSFFCNIFIGVKLFYSGVLVSAL